jgi:phosphoribosylamine--glycine ligase
VSNGGRVLCATAAGADLAAARAAAYSLVSGIDLDGAHYRTDIALAAAEGRATAPR